MSAPRQRRARRAPGYRAPGYQATAPRRRVTPEILVGLAAVLLSCGALVVSVFQARILREQQGATVWPHLALGTDRLDDSFTVTVSNAGVGPAIVREIEYAVRGRRYRSAWALAQGEIGGDTLYTTPKYFQTVVPGSVLRPGDGVETLSLPRNPALADRFDRLTADSSFHARVLYSDVYGMCWRIDNDVTRSAGRCADAEQ